ncbi:membrane protein [Lysobacter helvus]|uniref:Membrane protein n=3 Tax=Lysobacterales TaxID=135614 RepID=A0ABM7Q325_9GAMM|nr:membrane protein [Lysobacter caseinilyticus]BCT94794.1 membrane protein [Lysobacter helvus]
MMRRLLAGALLLCALASPARAHSLSVAYVDVEKPARGPTRAEIDVSVRDLALTLALDANHDEIVTWGEVQGSEAALRQLLQANVVFHTRAGRCTPQFASVALRRYDEAAYIAMPFTLDCPGSGAVTVDYRLLFDRDARHRALVTYREGAQVTNTVVTTSQRQVVLGDPANGSFLAFLREGIHHILTGYDHLAFLLSLLLPAALVWNGKAWRPGTGLRDSLAGTMAVVTAFTLAHSLTLSLAALGWVVPASRWIEAAIAASVLLAALNNLRPVATRRLWTIAFGFGLIHGFGFAGALTELGLPTGARLASLVGFNLGVEIGQLAVVALVLPLLFALRHRAIYARALMPAMSLGIAAIAGMWCVQRLAAFS